VVDPKKRLNAEEILKHDWVVGDKTPRKSLASVTSRIKELNAKKNDPKLMPN